MDQALTQPPVNTAQPVETGHGNKFFGYILQASIGVFTISLVWFSFVYYPKIVDRFQGVGLPQTQTAISAATFGEFPIQTEQFRIIYEDGSRTYYAFVEGGNIAEFADNKNRATLALKSALSLESACTLNVIYASTAKLEIPQDLKNPASCE